MAKLSRLKNEFKNLKKLIYRRLYVSKKTETSVITDFHELYYNSHLFGETWENTKWMGYPARKCPLDFWVYQEILFEVKPDIIVELGTCRGGSTLFLAHMCDLNKYGSVISVDIKERNNLPQHERITYLVGSTTSSEIEEKIKASIQIGNKVLVIADSNHRYAHVISELKIYNDLVSIGSYFIVEDGNLNGNPVCPEFGPGPAEAVRDFLETNNNFITDLSREKFYLTFNPKGYLKRVR